MDEHPGISLSEHFIITQRKYSPNAQGDLNILLNEIAVAGKIVRDKIALAGIAERLGETVGQANVTGDQVKALDMIANTLFKKRLLATGLVSLLISEEDDEPTISTGKYIVAIDPCDGSSNIECNVPVGTIFGIWNDDTEMGSLSRKNLICSGYLLYGPSCMFVYTTGHGVNGFTYDPSIGEFVLTHPTMKFPSYSKCYSINESYSNDWTIGVKKFVEWMKTPDKAEHRPYTSRYVGSLVSDFHRNLLYGGIYIYPTGKLRLLYECIPLSFIAEEAGGLGSDGKNAILNVKINNWHQKTPLYIGSRPDVEMAQAYLLLDREIKVPPETGL